MMHAGRQRIEELRDQLDPLEGPPRLPVILELSGLLFAAGDHAGAMKGYNEALQWAPRDPAILNNLAACHLELGEFRGAINYADRAIALAPGFDAAYLNRADAYRHRGRPREAARDYHEALRINPHNPNALNKAGAFNQRLNRHEEARRQFEAALKLAPGFSLARMNLGFVEISRARPEHARQHIRQALSDHSLDGESRRLGEVALGVLDEHRRLDSCLREAVHQHDPAGLETVLAACPASLLEPDPVSVDANLRYAEAFRKLETIEFASSYPADHPALPFVEACHQGRFEGSVTDLAAAWARYRQQGSVPRPDAGRDIKGLLEATQFRTKTPMGDALDRQPEAWLRYWHAVLLGKHDAALPGQFKATPNMLTAKGIIKPTPPEHVIGTLRHAFQELRPTLPPGLPRALFCWVAVIRLHAFNDGNGRLARFLFNWEMEASGLGAIAVSATLRPEFSQHAGMCIREADPGPLCSTLLKAREETARCLQEADATP
jgi:tetratricopeptide (TPR) repeat protein